MLRHTQIQRVQVRFVSASLSYRTPEIVRYKDLAYTLIIFKGVDMCPDPEGETL